MIQTTLFAEEDRLRKLSKLGNNLKKLDVIEWEMFRPVIDSVRPKSESKAGRPPYDSILMLKTLILKRINNLSNEETEYQINDRISFMRFIGIGLADSVPDSNTIDNFEKMLARSGVITEIFAMFGRQLEEKGLITHRGTIVDATFVDAPRQRNSREENEKIKNGEVPEEWKDNPHKLAQKDMDARWARKNNEVHFGYKDHVKADAESKIIVDYAVTDASVHDSNEFSGFINESDRVIYADSAYIGKELPEYVESQVCEKGFRNKPLTDEQKKSNRVKSKTRCRIEHIFGFMTGTMHGINLKTVGMLRAQFNIGLTNLIYNMFRYEILTRKKPTAG